MQTIPGLYGRDIAQILAPQGPPRQPMPGFDPDYADIVDYILRCTHRIWEQKDVGLIQTHYGTDCPVWTLAGPTIGAEAVTQNTCTMLSSFPDRELFGESVIWSDEGDGAYHSSHRITSHVSHLGPNEYGPATGRRAVFTTIADCLCRANRIVEEWLVRDTSGIALQLGVDWRALAAAGALSDAARDWIAQERARVLAAAATPWPDAPLADPRSDPQAFARGLFGRLWEHRRLNAVCDAYAPNCRFEGPRLLRLFGWAETTAWYDAIHAAFPGAKVTFDHFGAVREGPDQEIAVRWTLAAEHKGAGLLYGPAAGAPALILGITHWRLSGGRITDEVTMFDEIALTRQIIHGTPA